MRIKSFYLVYRARPALSVSLLSDCIVWLSLGAKTLILVIHAQHASPLSCNTPLVIGTNLFSI